MTVPARFAIVLMAMAFTNGFGQTINNLVHERGYVTAKWGELGEVKKFGTGPRSAILLAGWGFDWSIYQTFIERHKNEFSFYAVTLPGFGDTKAPPMPSNPEVFSDLHWTKGIIDGLVNLIDREKIVNPVIFSYFTYSEMIAIRLALEYPSKVSKVVVISGMPKFTVQYPSHEPRSLKTRIDYVENLLSKHWFKTVTKETWNKGNFAPATFTNDTLKAKQYWNQMSAVPIPVMVRYLCEYYCTDVSLEYADLKVPVLAVVPSFSQESLAANSYLAPFFHNSWLGAMPASKWIQVVTLTETQAFIFDDRPAKLDSLIGDFLNERPAYRNPLR